MTGCELLDGTPTRDSEGAKVESFINVRSHGLGSGGAAWRLCQAGDGHAYREDPSTRRRLRVCCFLPRQIYKVHTTLVATRYILSQTHTVPGRSPYREPMDYPKTQPLNGSYGAVSRKFQFLPPPPPFPPPKPGGGGGSRGVPLVKPLCGACPFVGYWGLFLNKLLSQKKKSQGGERAWACVGFVCIGPSGVRTPSIST